MTYLIIAIITSCICVWYACVSWSYPLHHIHEERSSESTNKRKCCLLTIPNQRYNGIHHLINLKHHPRYTAQLGAMILALLIAYSILTRMNIKSENVFTRRTDTLKALKYLSRPTHFSHHHQTCIVYPFMKRDLDSYFSLHDERMRERDFSYEWLRLESYRTMPPQSNMSLIRLAQSGFFWLNEKNSLVCYSCGFAVILPTVSNPVTEHKLRSPDCKHLLGTDDRNVSIDYRENRTVQEHNNLGNPVETNTSTEMSSYQDHASATSASAETQHVRDDVMHLETPVNRDNSRSAVYTLASRTGQNITSRRTQHTFGIQWDKPRYPAYAVITVRISSFEGWSVHMTQTPRSLAVAGFFYVGYGDYTRCFFCGGGLRNWGRGDDPWIEHARWFPRCTFLLMNKGDEFVSLVQEEHQLNEQQENNHLPLYGEGNPSLRSTYLTDNQLVTHDLYKQATAMGFPKEHILSKLREALNSHKGLSSIEQSEFIESLLTMAPGAANNTATTEVTRENETVEMMNEAASTANLTTLSAELSQMNMSKRNNSNEDNRQDEESTNTSVSIGSNEDSLSVETLSLLNENRELRRRRECKICLDAEANIALLPCGHLCCCASCSSAMRKCPICRKVVRGTVRTFQT